ncbi:MAG TPA: ABC transporter ATP-binding protein [Candidatus Limnocylindrales bacterium]
MIRRPKNGPSGNAGDIPGPASGHLIDLRSVVKDYVTDAGPFRALDGVDLQVDAGEFISVVGRSGCGKSTLMNMITGIDRATAGLVAVAGQDLALMSEGRTAVWRGRTVGVIFQFFQLLPTLTVVENVMLPMDFGGLWTPRERYDRAMSLLERVGMADQARKLPSSTSGGQQQRVAVARALANDPPLLVADEPTGNLDSATADVVFELFEAFVEQGRTIVTVTHDTELAKRTRRTVHMADGRILDGSLDANAGADAGAGTPMVPSAPVGVAVASDIAAADAPEAAGA